ncbi:LysR family transcriptional regulator [Achromobacter aloeverae]|uniref:LysR family transcriptional regulator n=1 Tax=Achromobacter aloeverae TaxID=1750518 RepID=A0A4Q1HDT6_9BURK|nr:LysR family transcriptional regulator [Achromobacter aloeverae]RXN83339.1 LysR family transcriptional regulator [Achromobacter aloeverae]
MELRHLRYFIAVAEARSFRVAAERIHITQPAITRQIQDLEAEVGVALFERSSVGVALTPAGEHILKDARAVLLKLEDSVRSARNIGAGLAGSLRIGFVENVSWDGVVPDAFARFQEQAPDLQLQLVPSNSPEQIRQIVADTLDGGFVYSFDDLPPGLSLLPLQQRHAVLAVPKQWMWPADRRVSAKELRDKRFVGFPRHTYPAYYDYLLRSCHRAGLALNIVQEVTTEAAILSLVSAGIGAAIVNASNRSRPPDRVAFFEFEDLKIGIPLGFVYAQANGNPALHRFLDLLEVLRREMA